MKTTIVWVALCVATAGLAVPALGGHVDPESVHWSANLEVSGSWGASSLRVGAASDATDGFDRSKDDPEPPPAPGGSYLSAYVRHTFAATGFERMNQSVVAYDTELMVWVVELAYSRAFSDPSQVTISWDPAALESFPDPEEGPMHVEVIGQKKRVDMRVQDETSMTVTGASGTARFVIAASREPFVANGEMFSATSGSSVQVTDGMPQDDKYGVRALTATFAQDCDEVSLNLDNSEAPEGEEVPESHDSFGVFSILLNDSQGNSRSDCISGGSMEFLVPQSATNGDPDRIVLLRLGDSWNQVTTELVSPADADPLLYRATLPGFSLWSVSFQTTDTGDTGSGSGGGGGGGVGERIDGDLDPDDEEEDPVEDTTRETDPEPEDDPIGGILANPAISGFNWVPLVVVGALLATLGGAGFVTLRDPARRERLADWISERLKGPKEPPQEPPQETPQETPQEPES